MERHPGGAAGGPTAREAVEGWVAAHPGGGPTEMLRELAAGGRDDGPLRAAMWDLVAEGRVVVDAARGLVAAR